MGRHGSFMATQRSAGISWLKFLALIVAAAFLGLSVLAYSAYSFLTSPMADFSEPVTIDVPAGSSLLAVANSLQRQQILAHPRWLAWYARFQGVGGSIKVGEYALQPGTTPQQLLRRMVDGDTIQYRLTLVEGWTVRDAVEAIWRGEHVQRELPSYDPVHIASMLGLERQSPEGMLFPDTYFYTKGTTDVELIARAHQRLQSVLSEQWQRRLGALPYAEPYEALVMASIIEKESAVGSERGHIAGVFVRRLELGMRLQSDPTVIYGMGATYEGDITRRDLNQVNEYNTYRVNGLPPTPIALAGLESISASLNPLPSDYLYFVSRGDGSHQFSETLEQHNAAVNQFQRNR